MKNLLTLSALLLAFLSVHAQNWRLFDPARKYYYGHANESVDHMLRIDSFHVAGNDTLWYPNRIHKPDSIPNDSCWPFIPFRSAFGAHIRQTPNSEYHVVYGNGDTLHLKLAATAPWRAFTGHGFAFSGWIDAFPLGKSVGMTPLGTTDSIISMELRFFYTNGTQYLTVPLRIGKQHGMFKLPLVPPRYNLNGYLGRFTFDTTLTLAGISNPDLGVQNIPRDRFFSMQPGDTIQIHTFDYDNGGEMYLWNWRQDIYLSRTLSTNGDTIFFQIDRQEFSTAHNRMTPPPFRTTVTEAIPINTSMYHRLDRDLGEFETSDEDASAWAWNWRIDPEFPERIMKPMNLIEPYDTTLQCHRNQWPVIYIHDTFDKYFMDGLGGPYYSFNYPSFYEGFRRPVYFRLGGVARGTYVEFESHTAVSEPLASSFAIYPNPCGDILQVDLSKAGVGEPALMEVISLQGQVLQSASLKWGEVSSHSIAGLPAGVYFVQINSPEGRSIQKLIKR